MNKRDLILCRLPAKRTGLRVALLAACPMWLIVLIGFGMYISVVALVSGIEWDYSGTNQGWVVSDNGAVTRWWDLVYFNFVSILTIGYGDYWPQGDGARAITLLEALVGTGILGITLAALTAKYLSPPKNAVVFSRYAYYCTEDEKILVIFLNTTRSRLVNAEVSSYFKLGGDWGVRPSVRSPFVTNAVQTFFTDSVREEELIKSLDEASDVFRFGISGQLGAAFFSAAIEYKPSDIIVLRNRDALIAYPGFWNVDLRSAELHEMFHYHPANTPTLAEYIETLRQRV